MSKTKDNMKKGIGKRILLVVVGIIVVLLVASSIYMNNLRKKGEIEKSNHPGNAKQYSLENVATKEDSPLAGKSILFLGSSVTYGDGSLGISMADYIGKIDNVNVTKEAVCATTLVDEDSIFAQLGYGDGRSYVTRLKENVDTNQHFDAVVVQLSTNDATTGKELGTLTDSFNKEDFDAKTVTGAIETIIAYVDETWGCPVIFYTGSYYESEAYAAMVERLFEIQDKWQIAVVDLYTDIEFNDIDEESYNLYMKDKIHPTKAGYLEWWTPEIEKILYESL